MVFDPFHWPASRYGMEGKQVRTALLATVALAAAAHAADIPGRYSLRNVREMGSEIVLRADGWFEFMLVYGAADYWASGQWQMQNGAVVLNTAGEPKPPFHLSASSAAAHAEVQVTVAGAGGAPVPNIDVALDGAGGTEEARTDSEGVAHFEHGAKPKSVAFRIRVYQFESEPISVNPAHNDFRFEIDGREITKIRFQNEKMLVSGDALVLRFFGADHPLRYEKQ
jgi:hypothetical protein